jgi:hypothetical protein
VGDEVVAINDIDVRELSIGTIKQLTVGPVGSWAKLDMLRGSLPYSVTLERLLPTHTSLHNADATGVLVHASAGYTGRLGPDGETARLTPHYGGGPRQSARASRRNSGWDAPAPAPALPAGGAGGGRADLGPQWLGSMRSQSGVFFPPPPRPPSEIIV